MSENTVKTFDGMNWDFSADYATHDRHIKADLLEYMGPGIESISFSMTLSVFLGVNPLKEIKKLREMVRKGYAERLVIGGKVCCGHPETQCPGIPFQVSSFSVCTPSISIIGISFPVKAFSSKVISPRIARGSYSSIWSCVGNAERDG